MSPSHQNLAVNRQVADAKSLLNFYRLLLTWRKQWRALVSGSMRLCQEHPHCLAFIRQSESQALLCVFNLSGFSQQLDDKQLDFSESKLKHAKLLPSPLSGLTMSDQGLSLSAWGCGVLDISAHPACR
jgi:glycosidase